MKNKILYRVYFVRLLPLLVLYSIMLFVIMMDEIVFHENYETVFYIVMLAMTGCVAMYMMRSPKDHEFVNALPVTKKQQWGCMYMALLTVVFIVYALYVLVVALAFKNEVNTMPEIIISGIVKAVSAILAMSFMLWVFSHTDFRFPVKVVICLVLIIFGLPAVGSLIQKAFNTGANNFVYELKTFWKLMTVPKNIFEVRNIRDMGVTYDKTAVVITYLMVAIALSILLAMLARKNYSDMDLSKNPKSGNVKGFSPILVAICVALAAMGVCSRAIQLFDKLRLEVAGSLYTINYEGPLLEEFYLSDDTDMVVVYKDSEVYYYGLVSANSSKDYEIYNVDFPKDYFYFFIGSMVVSVGAGIVVALIGKKEKRGECENGVV